MADAAPSLTLRSRASNDAERMLRDQGSLQQALFSTTGVILPLVRHEHDDEIERDRLELRLNGRPIASHRPSASEEASSLFLKQDLEPHAAEFVVSQLVEHYLDQLSQAYPDLVRSVRASFRVDDLTSVLRGRVESGASIRDLRSVLEEILQTRA